MMKFQECLRYTFIIFLSMFAASSFAQQANGTLRGQVTDPSGAAISGASVIMTPVNGSPIVIQSNPQGMYEFKALPLRQVHPYCCRHRVHTLRKRQRSHRRPALAVERHDGDRSGDAEGAGFRHRAYD